MHRHLKHVCLSLLVIWPSLAWGQLAVFDAPNHSRNTITAFQSTITAIESVVHTGYWFLELEPWGANPLEGSFDVDMVELDAIIRETQGILFEITVIQDQFRRLFNLDMAPVSTGDLWNRLVEIRHVRAEAYQKAREIQTLPGRITNVIGRMAGLAGRIMEVLGAKQGIQQLQAMMQNMTMAQAQTQVIIGAYQQAVLTDLAERALVEHSWDLINEQLMMDWPK